MEELTRPFPMYALARRRSVPSNPALRLQQVLGKQTRHVIGLMSGMSMDGVNLAYVRISGQAPGMDIQLLDAHYRPYPAALRQVLQTARVHGSARDVCQLNVQVAEEFAACVSEFLRLRRIEPGEVDAIGSHGQTLVHIPPGSDEVASTLQIGSGSVIAERTGLLTVSNFRVRDMAVGGQGAPLVPLVDYLLFARSSGCMALNNLGSISNLTVVPPKLEDLMAFDTGPANMPIDFFAQAMGQTCDLDGEFSARGRVLPELLAELLALPYFQQSPPKSAGYQEFGPAVLEGVGRRYAAASPYDLLRTAVELTAETIARAYERFVFPQFPDLRRALFSGGGIRNRTLMRRLQERLPQLSIETSFDLGEGFADAKEALSFAVLANETLSGRPTCLPGATGARVPVVSGELSL